MDKNIKKVAVSAAKKAGKMLLKEYKNFDRSTIKLKHHREILTRADLLSEELIIKEIKKNFPYHKILSEEAGEIKSESEYLWIIDPVDGTTNFSMHNPLWSISIGVAYCPLPDPPPLCSPRERELEENDGEVILGVIFAPVLGEMYITEKDKGVKLNGKKIRVSSFKDKVLNTFCHARDDKHVRRAIKYYSYQKMHGLDCRQMGSAAIELAYVAAGRTESIVIPGANAWDVAAGVLMVREAGGRVTDFSGQAWNLSSVDMLASNGKVHKDILEVLNRG